VEAHHCAGVHANDVTVDRADSARLPV